MIFRQMTPADIPASFLIRTAAKENPFPMEALTASGITPASVTQMLATTHRGWVCEVAGNVVGFAIGNRRNGEFWVIAVLQEHEGKGIGRRLMLLVQDWLWSEGWTKLWLVTGVAPSRAFHLYSKFGWRDCGPVGEGVERRMELTRT